MNGESIRLEYELHVVVERSKDNLHQKDNGSGALGRSSRQGNSERYFSK